MCWMRETERSIPIGTGEKESGTPPTVEWIAGLIAIPTWRLTPAWQLTRATSPEPASIGRQRFDEAVKTPAPYPGPPRRCWKELNRASPTQVLGTSFRIQVNRHGFPTPSDQRQVGAAQRRGQ